MVCKGYILDGFKPFTPVSATDINFIDFTLSNARRFNSSIGNPWELKGLNTALHWFQSYLTEREQTTHVGISISLPLIITHGVPSWDPCYSGYISMTYLMLSESAQLSHMLMTQSFSYSLQLMTMSMLLVRSSKTLTE